jgi:hypothetical protein
VRLPKSEPTFIASEAEAVWELADHRWLVIEQNAEHAGRILQDDGPDYPPEDLPCRHCPIAPAMQRRESVSLLTRCGANRINRDSHVWGVQDWVK